MILILIWFDFLVTILKVCNCSKRYRAYISIQTQTLGQFHRHSTVEDHPIGLFVLIASIGLLRYHWRHGRDATCSHFFCRSQAFARLSPDVIQQFRFSAVSFCHITSFTLSAQWKVKIALLKYCCGKDLFYCFSVVCYLIGIHFWWAHLILLLTNML